MKRSTRTKKPRTYLFTIRVWAEKLDNDIYEWRGKVQNVSEDEGFYFRGWLALIEILQSLVSEGIFEEKAQ